MDPGMNGRSIAKGRAGAAVGLDGRLAQLRVLASGSSGNCSLLSYLAGSGSSGGGGVRHALIDAGISPRRIGLGLEACGLGWGDIGAILLTHLDADHAHPGLARALRKRPGVRVLVHERHIRAARGAGLSAEPVCAMDVRCEAMLLPHDGLGVAAFRFEFCVEVGAEFGGTPGGRCVEGSLGFATDLGCVPTGLVEVLRGVDVLAIESNYCPDLQHESDRPDFLKRRITGGAGHLSNREALRAIEEIEPREHVVLLHLSRQCNHPAIVAEMHAGADYAYTIAEADRPTRWVPLHGREGGRALRARLLEPAVHVQQGLFGAGAAARAGRGS